MASRPPRRNPWHTAGAVVVLLSLPIVVSSAWVHASTRRWATMCCYYRPNGLLHGEIWKTLGSALLLVNPNPFGATILFTLLVFVPYAFFRGPGRAATTFVAGHLATTMSVAAVILTGAALHLPTAVRLARTSDVGMSAGLAAVTGALTVRLATRRPWSLCLVPAAAITLLIVSGVAQHRYLVQSEHLIGFAVGAGLEAAAQMRRQASPIAQPVT